MDEFYSLVKAATPEQWAWLGSIVILMAIAAIDGVADKLEIICSEVLERLARSESWNADELREIGGEKES
jgi:hypothetical protein